MRTIFGLKLKQKRNTAIISPDTFKEIVSKNKEVRAADASDGRRQSREFAAARKRRSRRARRDDRRQIHAEQLGLLRASRHGRRHRRRTTIAHPLHATRRRKGGKLVRCGRRRAAKRRKVCIRKTQKFGWSKLSRKRPPSRFDRRQQRKKFIAEPLARLQLTIGAQRRDRQPVGRRIAGSAAVGAAVVDARDRLAIAAAVAFELEARRDMLDAVGRTLVILGASQPRRF